MSECASGGGGGGCNLTSRKLNSGKAKKTKLLEKREKERQRAERELQQERIRLQADDEQRRANFLAGRTTIAATTAAASSHPLSLSDSGNSSDSDCGIQCRRKNTGAARAGAAASTASHSNSNSSSLGDQSDSDSDVGIRIIPRIASSVKPETVKPPLPIRDAADSVAKLELVGGAATIYKGNDSDSNEANKLRTVFAKESKEVIEQRKLAARVPLQIVEDGRHGCSSVESYAESSSHAIDLPMRPAWSRSFSKQQIHDQEEASFQAWLNAIYQKYDRSRLNHFEHNLHVWRQLWRVCERSDILFIIVDCRHPLFNFPPSLYKYITSTLNKPLCMILNKVDLIPPSALQQWLAYFGRVFPKLSVVPFTSFPHYEANQLHIHRAFNPNKKSKIRKPQGMIMSAPYGANLLRDICHKLLQSHPSLQSLYSSVKQNFSFNAKLLQADGAAGGSAQQYADADEYMNINAPMPSSKRGNKSKHSDSSSSQTQLYNDDDDDGGGDEDEENEVLSQQFGLSLGLLEDEDDEVANGDGGNGGGGTPAASSNNNRRDPRSYVTLGMLGHPNAGKSSVINALAGHKVVSVSATPGHTKSLQTLFLNSATRLCDCPGLIFPCVDSEPALQVIAGCFPIAQTRDPYMAIAFMAARVPLPKIYNLKPLSGEDAEYSMSGGTNKWTAWSICESLALQKGFRNRNGDLDVYRAANLILRDVLDGNFSFFFLPPNH